MYVNIGIELYANYKIDYIWRIIVNLNNKAKYGNTINHNYI